jgi:hypothetical protein
MRIEINHEFFEAFGTGTLSGHIAKAGIPLAEVKEVELVFHDTSMKYRHKNGGPHLLIMPEYVPLCFLEDIFRLQELGIKFTLATKTVDEPTKQPPRIRTEG